jgi:Ataxin-1 and HBP1 module (AXH).
MIRHLIKQYNYCGISSFKPGQMKKTFSISLLFLIIFSCSKPDDHLTSDCSHFSQSSTPIVCDGSICQSDTCQTYFGIWKEIFLAKNQMNQEYFDNHITLCNTGTFKNTQQGISFYLSFKIIIEWFEVKLEEENFLILLSPAYTQQYPELGLPNNILLSKDQINGQINNTFFSSPIPTITPVNHLIYPTKQEAAKALAVAAGVNSICPVTINLKYPDGTNMPAGHPFLEARGVVNWDEDKCVTGEMDLVTGDIVIDNYGCRPIVFCFTKGTDIVQNNGMTKSIENIRAGDTILSVNQETMRIETDVVKQIDSVRHKDIVHISFSDLTQNNNTFDHPYYVKDKGWCSYKPSETLQKYNLKTKQLQIGDTCFKYKNNKLIEIQIKNISENSGEVMTYNISRLERNKTYFANGILVSNENN